MEENPDNSWNEIRKRFSLALFKPCAGGVNFLEFTACEKPETPSKLCHIAQCLLEPIRYLKERTGCQWVTVIQYDPNALPHDVHKKHLNFYVTPKLQEIFEAEKDRMFLMTGVACGFPLYRPAANISTEPFPMFELRYAKQDASTTVPSQQPDHHIVFKISLPATNNCCSDKLQSCVTCKDGMKDAAIEIMVPEAWKLYVDHIPLLKDSEQNKLMRTLHNFVFEYPPKAPEILPNNWSTLFLPGVHVPNYPYYVNGVLIAFDGEINEQMLTIVRDWTSDICYLLTGSVMLHSKKDGLHGPWMLGTGEASGEYFDAYTFTCKDSRVLGIVNLEKGRQKLYEANLPGEWHDLLDNAANENVAATLTDDNDKECFAIFEKTFPSWIAWFGVLGVPESKRATVAYSAFTLLNNNNIHLLALLAFCKDAGFNVTTEAGSLKIVCKNTQWPGESVSICAQFILKQLIYESGKSISKGAKCSAIVSIQQNKVIFCLDIVLPFPKENSGKQEESQKNLYLDWLQKGRLDQHYLTQTILAAEQLGKPGYLDVRPIWDDVIIDQNKLVEDWKKSNKDGALVVLEKAKSQIIVKRTWGK